MLKPYTEGAWSRLQPPPVIGRILPLDQLALFQPDDSFFGRRIAYLDKFVAGCTSVLSTGRLATKLICSRYTVGLPLLDPLAVSAFREAMSDYREAVVAARASAAMANE
ncbi:hypothetical protein [Mycobacterium sp.]|uniref:hypothetical protein n=1 Tax=Mycobacterium sp. TaxID=1785 RepID=UPI003D0CA026